MLQETCKISKFVGMKIEEAIVIASEMLSGPDWKTL